MQTPDNNNYEFHNDAGHGWLRVPFVELIELGLQPTEFSYTDGEYAYLEEDLDAGNFLRALDPQTDIREICGKWNIPNIDDGNYSFIRGLRHIGKITKPTKPAGHKGGYTLFPEIFGKWGIETESAAERKAKGSLHERHRKAVRIIKKLRGWKSDTWYLMPVLWLEAKAAELCEAAEAERVARAEREKRLAEEQSAVSETAKAA